MKRKLYQLMGNECNENVLYSVYGWTMLEFMSILFIEYLIWLSYKNSVSLFFMFGNLHGIKIMKKYSFKEKFILIAGIASIAICLYLKDYVIIYLVLFSYLFFWSLDTFFLKKNH